VTFDRFHVIKLMNERLDDLRRDNWPGRLRITMPRRLSRDCVGCFYTGTITWRKTLPGVLKRSLALNAPLQCAYLLKEELGELWEQKDGREAWGFLREWCAKAKASGIRQLQGMAVTLLRHAKGVLSYYKTA
jgi:transposase